LSRPGVNPVTLGGRAVPQTSQRQPGSTHIDPVGALFL